MSNHICPVCGKEFEAALDSCPVCGCPVVDETALAVSEEMRSVARSLMSEGQYDAALAVLSHGDTSDEEMSALMDECRRLKDEASRSISSSSAASNVADSPAPPAVSSSLPPPLPFAERNVQPLSPVQPEQTVPSGASETAAVSDLEAEAEACEREEYARRGFFERINIPVLVVLCAVFPLGMNLIGFELDDAPLRVFSITSLGALCALIYASVLKLACSKGVRVFVLVGMAAAVLLQCAGFLSDAIAYDSFLSGDDWLGSFHGYEPPAVVPFFYLFAGVLNLAVLIAARVAAQSRYAFGLTCLIAVVAYDVTNSGFLAFTGEDFWSWYGEISNAALAIFVERVCMVIGWSALIYAALQRGFPTPRTTSLPTHLLEVDDEGRETFTFFRPTGIRLVAFLGLLLILLCALMDIFEPSWETGRFLGERMILGGWWPIFFPLTLLVYLYLVVATAYESERVLPKVLAWTLVGISGLIVMCGFLIEMASRGRFHFDDAPLMGIHVAVVASLLAGAAYFWYMKNTVPAGTMRRLMSCGVAAPLSSIVGFLYLGGMYFCGEYFSVYYLTNITLAPFAVCFLAFTRQDEVRVRHSFLIVLGFSIALLALRFFVSTNL